MDPQVVVPKYKFIVYILIGPAEYLFLDLTFSLFHSLFKRYIYFGRSDTIVK